MWIYPGHQSKDGSWPDALKSSWEGCRSTFSVAQEKFCLTSEQNIKQQNEASKPKSTLESSETLSRLKLWIINLYFVLKI